MKVGFVQFKPEFGDKKANLDKIAALAKQERSDLLVFPEMCTTGYVVKSKIELKDLAEEIPSGPTATELVKIAKGVGSILIAGLPEIVGRKIYNSAVVVGPGGYIAKHQKSHLFLNESKYFSPGQTKPTIFKWQEFRIGLGICYDYMFPEYWRTLALQGADLFCNPANFVFDYGFKMMQARALENGVFSVCTNRIGEERGVEFRGGSEIVNNRGEVIKKASQQEELVIVDLDLKKSRDKRWNSDNDLLADRRPELYNL